jgi:hypothetical protein
MKNFNTVFLEGSVVGIFLIVFIYISAFLLILFNYPRVELPSDCKNYNKTYIMEATAFLAGLLFHIACEYTGVNEWYVKNYYA